MRMRKYYWILLTVTTVDDVTAFSGLIHITQRIHTKACTIRRSSEWLRSSHTNPEWFHSDLLIESFSVNKTHHERDATTGFFTPLDESLSVGIDSDRDISTTRPDDVVTVCKSTEVNSKNSTTRSHDEFDEAIAKHDLIENDFKDPYLESLVQLEGIQTTDNTMPDYQGLSLPKKRSNLAAMTTISSYSQSEIETDYDDQVQQVVESNNIEDRWEIAARRQEEALARARVEVKKLKEKALAQKRLDEQVTQQKNDIGGDTMWNDANTLSFSSTMDVEDESDGLFLSFNIMLDVPQKVTMGAALTGLILATLLLDHLDIYYVTPFGPGNLDWFFVLFPISSAYLAVTESSCGQFMRLAGDWLTRLIELIVVLCREVLNALHGVWPTVKEPLKTFVRQASWKWRETVYFAVEYRRLHALLEYKAQTECKQRKLLERRLQSEAFERSRRQSNPMKANKETSKASHSLRSGIHRQRDTHVSKTSSRTRMEAVVAEKVSDGERWNLEEEKSILKAAETKKMDDLKAAKLLILKAEKKRLDRKRNEREACEVKARESRMQYRFTLSSKATTPDDISLLSPEGRHSINEKKVQLFKEKAQKRVLAQQQSEMANTSAMRIKRKELSQHNAYKPKRSFNPRGKSTARLSLPSVLSFNPRGKSTARLSLTSALEARVNVRIHTFKDTKKPSSPERESSAIDSGSCEVSLRKDDVVDKSKTSEWKKKSILTTAKTFLVIGIWGSRIKDVLLHGKASSQTSNDSTSIRKVALYLLAASSALIHTKTSFFQSSVIITKSKSPLEIN